MNIQAGVRAGEGVATRLLDVLPLQRSRRKSKNRAEMFSFCQLGDLPGGHMVQWSIMSVLTLLIVVIGGEPNVF